MSERKIHILVVEDETIIALDIEQTLEEFGYVVDELASNVEDAMYYIQKYKPDLVLMDIKLKGESDGISIVEEIQDKYDIPVIYLTSHSDKDTLLRAQKTKPYGYITKPMDERQLNSSIMMALARKEAEGSKKTIISDLVNLKYGYRFDTKRNVLIYDNVDVSLTKKELTLISFLIKNLNVIVSIDSIIQNVWSEKYVSDATLRSLVRRVREKLGNEIIENCNSLGYVIKGE